MKDVKRYRADWRHVVETEFDDAQLVGATDYDAALSKLAAETLRADTAEAELERFRRSRNAMLTNVMNARDAAEQRIVALTDILRDAYKFPIKHVCATGSWPAQELCERIEAALNPKPEAAEESKCTCWLQPQEPQCVDCPDRKTKPEAGSHE